MVSHIRIRNDFFVVQTARVYKCKRSVAISVGGNGGTAQGLQKRSKRKRGSEQFLPNVTRGSSE